MIRVLLAEDQAMVRGALSALLSLESDIEVLAAVADGVQAWQEVQRLKPDVLVTDIEMPELTGLELAQRIQRHELPVKVIIVTTFARPGFLRRALDAGVSGYLLKDAPAEDHEFHVIAPKAFLPDGKPVAQIRPSATDRKSTRLNSSHIQKSRMPSSA